MSHTSLKGLLREVAGVFGWDNELMCGPSECSLKEEADYRADKFIKGLKECMREAREDVIAPSCRDPNCWRNEDWFASGKQNGFDLATKTMFKILKGEQTK